MLIYMSCYITNRHLDNTIYSTHVDVKSCGVIDNHKKKKKIKKDISQRTAKISHLHICRYQTQNNVNVTTT